jgi:hypothetical protein
MGAGDGLGDGAERAVDLAVEGKAMFQHLDLKRTALVAAGQEGTRPRQAVVGR